MSPVLTEKSYILIATFTNVTYIIIIIIIIIIMGVHLGY